MIWEIENSCTYWYSNSDTSVFQLVANRYTDRAIWAPEVGVQESCPCNKETKQKHTHKPMSKQGNVYRLDSNHSIDQKHQPWCGEKKYISLYKLILIIIIIITTINALEM
jgi:hypothetical protein